MVCAATKEKKGGSWTLSNKGRMSLSKAAEPSGRRRGMGDASPEKGVVSEKNV